MFATPFRYTRFVVRPFTVRSIVALILGILVSGVIANIETVIYQNDIHDVQGVTSTGQLIPLTVGVIGFGVLVYRRFQDESQKVYRPYPVLLIDRADWE